MLRVRPEGAKHLDARGTYEVGQLRVVMGHRSIPKAHVALWYIHGPYTKGYHITKSASMYIPATFWSLGAWENMEMNATLDASGTPSSLPSLQIQEPSAPLSSAEARCTSAIRGHDLFSRTRLSMAPWQECAEPTQAH